MRVVKPNTSRMVQADRTYSASKPVKNSNITGKTTKYPKLAPARKSSVDAITKGRTSFFSLA